MFSGTAGKETKGGSLFFEAAEFVGGFRGQPRGKLQFWVAAGKVDRWYMKLNLEVSRYGSQRATSGRNEQTDQIHLESLSNPSNLVDIGRGAKK